MMDTDLENAIDKAGRTDVFALASGWADEIAPPKWIWWAAVRAVENLKEDRHATPPT